MVKAVRMESFGGPEVMAYVDVEPGQPGPGEARVRNHCCGLNYVDISHRSGNYPLELPSGLGLEGAGLVEAVGEGVTDIQPGDRVAYCTGPLGAYAQARIMPADVLIRLPDGIEFETAAAMMLKGLTAQYLLRRTYKLRKGQTILFHAAAGGVGLFAMQWAKTLGVTVIGTVGSEEKAKLAKAHGCGHTILYREENIVDRVREITNGEMVPVVYDSVGKDTFQASLDCLQPFGLLVSFGNASGPVPPMEMSALKGSLYVTRPSLTSYGRKRADLQAMADDLFELVLSRQMKVTVDQRYPLADIQRAHQDLQNRRTRGSSVLIP